MKHVFPMLALVLAPASALAAEKVVLTNYYVTDTRTYPTGEKTGYWEVTFTGISEATAGPLDTMPIECHGAGYWGAEGPWGDGMCVSGAGDDLIFWLWEAPKGGEANTWEIVGGTGKYAGITGAGTARSETLSPNRRVSYLEGEVSLP